jgi:DNA-binding MarR family transcriptional regulator
MPAPGSLTQPQCLSDLLLFRINRLLSVGGAPVIRLCEGTHGISRREWRLLAAMAAASGLMPSQLAQHAQLDRARTSKAITSLVQKKLVQREVQLGDKRKAVVSLTASGRALHARLFPQVLMIHHKLLGALTQAEVMLLEGLLDKLQGSANDLQEHIGGPKADRRRGAKSTVQAAIL